MIRIRIFCENLKNMTVLQVRRDESELQSLDIKDIKPKKANSLKSSAALLEVSDNRSVTCTIITFQHVKLPSTFLSKFPSLTIIVCQALCSSKCNENPSTKVIVD